MSDSVVRARNHSRLNVIEGDNFSKQFNAYDKPETVTTHWLRLISKAAKVGRGLSKDENAKHLAVQNWLEAIDAEHRYGHNLSIYYDYWLKSQTREPFFYWLDMGEGREVSLPDCSRSKLQKQLVTYLGPNERKQYEVVIKDGKLMYKHSGELINTPKGEKWIFVMSPSKKFYVHQKEKGTFQHSSFLAGGATAAAGRLLAKNGIIKVLEAHSGHYRPTEENFNVLVDVLVENGADLSMAKCVDRKGSKSRIKNAGLWLKFKQFICFKHL